MLKKIIKIDEERCNGCGDCAIACHEGAIEIIDGKAKLTREDYCDGLGDCLPACKMNAISFEMREISKGAENTARAYNANAVSDDTGTIQSTQLMQWPCKLRLVPTYAPYLDNSDLLITADCAAYAFRSFHNTFMKNRITLTMCPKFDQADYVTKLGEIILNNNIKSITVVRMEIPCCSGTERTVTAALESTGKSIPYNVVTLSTNGKILK